MAIAPMAIAPMAILVAFVMVPTPHMAMVACPPPITVVCAYTHDENDDDGNQNHYPCYW